MKVTVSHTSRSAVPKSIAAEPDDLLRDLFPEVPALGLRERKKASAMRLLQQIAPTRTSGNFDTREAPTSSSPGGTGSRSTRPGSRARTR